MNHPNALLTRRPPDAERGQMIVLFTLVLFVLIATAGLLVDGGMAQETRRQAQAAADTAALAAAQAIGAGASGSTAAASISAANGFPATTTNCSGVSVAGVTVNNPPTSGTYAGNPSYVEIVVQRPMKTGFSGLVGQSCWMVSARAVATVSSSGVAPCSFCAINDTNVNHTLVLQSSSTLRVDGDIYVNSSNGGFTPNTCKLSQWNVCGDAFDTFGTGGYISAKTIAVNGGWETHDQNIATADGLAQVNGAACPEHPNPPSQAQTANVCIHMPQIADPLNDPAHPGNIVQPPTPGSRPIAGQNGCPNTATSGSGTAASPLLLTISSGTPTICPGTYYGGIKITAGSVTMMAGVYNIVGGGFTISGTANVNGSAGVMIYNSSGSGEATSTTSGTDHTPAPIAGHANPKLAAGLISNANNVAPGTTVTYTMTIDKNGAGNPSPSGVVDFWDSNTEICAAVPLVSATGTRMAATCSQTYPLWGSHSISASYDGDTIYNGIGDTLTETVKTPAGAASPVSITGTGTVKLSGPSSGAYSGLTIFQDRSSTLTMTISPGAGAGTCPANFMTMTLTNATATANGCGPLGGLQGTIYAANDTALVLITASGLTPLQVLAGEIEVDGGASARFAYNAAVFANGSVHLVE
jgi:Flp pilus assembly protein TadG